MVDTGYFGRKSGISRTFLILFRSTPKTAENFDSLIRLFVLVVLFLFNCRV
ncbi:hypothetical protein MEG1DRAFT_03654 [Photorhabdus temperata subsp. temperata Meg1]|uniref:Uncharacterized protein n=1 Tax=Photorhabdus temperata subsp. temperata Meg1 TaxID=1393735 RepID=A0A081RSP5_PHOTE|nr:hypothetical protein MEG1DRAFT_03654 [Photorhabdus temperata subsp. temperata Meg1]